MDIYCPVCGSAWDPDELHEMNEWVGVDLTYAQAARRFRQDGCAAFGLPHEPINRQVAEASAVCLDLLGDDIDAVASMMDAYLQVEP